MAEVKHNVCDECGESEGVVTYSVGVRTSTPWLVDLCPEHATPIVRWREVGRTGGPGRRPYRKYRKVPTKPA